MNLVRLRDDHFSDVAHRNIRPSLVEWLITHTPGYHFQFFNDGADVNFATPEDGAKFKIFWF